MPSSQSALSGSTTTKRAAQRVSERSNTFAKRALLPTVLAGALLLSLTGCNWWKKDSEKIGAKAQAGDAVTVFFSKYQGDHSIVEAVVRKLPPEGRKEPLNYALHELLKGPSSDEKTQGFYSEIPKGTQLLNIKENETTVTVDLSNQFNSGGGSTSMEQRFEELKQTVYAVDNKHTLNIAIDGKPVETLGGEGLEVQEEAKRNLQ